MILIDNCPSHKTSMTLKTLAKLDVPVLFSAPASFKAIPVEGVFGAIKAVDFSKIPDSDPAPVSTERVKKMTLKQKLMMKVSNYLFTLTPDMLTSHYR